MSRALAIAGRECRAYFLTPGGYIVIALFLVVTGFIFAFQVFNDGEIASLRPVFGMGTWALTFVAPAVTMRLIAEEYRAGTWEALAACPVREVEVIFGKFLGALGLLAAMLAPTLLYVVALEMFGRPDYGEIACGYLGLLVAGSAYVASGLLVSTFTSSQPVAFLVTVFFWLVMGLGAKLLPQHLGDAGREIVVSLDPHLRLNDFVIGLMDTSNVVYFLTLTAVFLAAAALSLQLRRWR